jgi:hypothetical protein
MPPQTAGRLVFDRQLRISKFSDISDMKALIEERRRLVRRLLIWSVHQTRQTLHFTKSGKSCFRIT